MRLFALTVNIFFLLRRRFRRSPTTLRLLDFVNRFIGEANYSKALPGLQVLRCKMWNYSVSVINLNCGSALILSWLNGSVGHSLRE
jgi:hypothetical protein